MSVRVSRPSAANSWIAPVSTAAFILGLLITVAWTNQERAKKVDPDIFIRMASGKLDLQQVQKLSEEITHLRDENTKLQNAVGASSKDTKVLNDSLQQVKLFAGLTEVEGPGITITLTDSKNKDMLEGDRIIHDLDVLHVVNELWASGAEAIEVNGHRIVGSTCIRCVGPVILVDNKPIASPVHIRAIGDTDTLMGAVQLPGGVLDMIKSADPNMVRIDRVKEHRFAAFDGSVQRKNLKVPKDAK